MVVIKFGSPAWNASKDIDLVVPHSFRLVGDKLHGWSRFAVAAPIVLKHPGVDLAGRILEMIRSFLLAFVAVAGWRQHLVGMRLHVLLVVLSIHCGHGEGLQTCTSSLYISTHPWCKHMVPHPSVKTTARHINQLTLLARVRTCAVAKLSLV